jgi:hypothetical protein
MLKVFAEIWGYLRDLAMVARPCRMSVFVVLAGGILLLATPQGSELTVRLPTEGLGKIVWFNVCVFLWAFQSWYWSRIVLDVTFGLQRGADLDHPRRERIHRLIVRLPRAIAIAAYAIAIIACLLTGRAAWLITLFLFMEGALFIAFLVYRGRLLKKLDAGSRISRLFVERGTDSGSLWSFPLFSKIVIGATFAAEVGLMAWACVDAVSFGWTFGAAAVPFLGFSMLVPVGSLLILLAREGGSGLLVGESPHWSETARSYPVIWILIGVAVLFSLVPAFDNHKVRTAPGVAIPGTPLDRALSQWYRQAPRSAVDARRNMVVVAAAGGGLRAAYWTSTVLGHIQDKSPSFHRQLLGISGVSGGAVGATVFVTLLGEEELPAQATRCEDSTIGAYECAGQNVLSQDFLGPTVAALLFPDLMQRFLPLGFPDRAGALEQSWERAWERAGFPAATWRDWGFRALWSDEKFRPALLLNGTHVETGKRIITSNIDIAGNPEVFLDAYDFYRLISAKSHIRSSTAAHNSARFTYVSPASTLEDGTHLVDGGYFENFGAVTARELLRAAMVTYPQGVRPIVILISNDHGLSEDDLPRRPPINPKQVKPQSWAHEVLSPLRALLHTRDARGLLAAAELRDVAERAGGRYFQFRLCDDPKRPDVALGWVLSDDSEDLMREQLRSDACGNKARLEELLQVLAVR